METAPAIDGHVLREGREHAGLSQNDLARRVGLAGGQRISRWERGEARPRTPELLHRIAEALGVDPVSLLVPPEHGPNLRWLRFAAGISAQQLAQASHASISTVKRWEAEGLTDASDGTVATIAAALGAEPQQVRTALRPLST